jgi:methionyl-tRNA formyltransferase
MLIQILVDNPDSWILPHIKVLENQIKEKFNYDVIILNNHDYVVSGDILFILSCEKKFNRLDLNKNNIVVHESALPKGKGWSPLTWQILENKTKIPITLFEAVEQIDAGEIYLQDYIFLEGWELLSEIKNIQGQITNKLLLKYLELYPNIKGKIQVGKETFYKRRTSKDSELNIEKSIKDQFNLLRICDNEKYPAFFIMNNRKYILKIYEENE